MFQNGVLKYSVNSEAEPEGFTELSVKQISYPAKSKSVLAYSLHPVVVEIESGTKTTYWVTDKIKRLPLSYLNNKFGYANEIMASVNGIHLYQEKTVAGVFITTEEASAIDFQPPNPNLFVMPAIKAYRW